MRGKIVIPKRKYGARVQFKVWFCEKAGHPQRDYKLPVETEDYFFAPLSKAGIIGMIRIFSRG